MADKILIKEELITVKAQAESVVSMLESTHKTASSLESDLAGMSWSGEHAEHIRMLLSMVVAYHGELAEASDKLSTAMTNLHTNYNNFSSIASFIGVKEIPDE